MVNRGRVAPLHAVFSSIPLGLFVGASAFDVASRLAPEPFQFPRGAFWLMVLAVATSVVAGVPGIVWLLQLDPASDRAAIGRKHVLITDVGIVAGVVSLLFRRSGDYAVAVGIPATVAGLAATGFVLGGSWLAATSRLQHQDA